VRGHAGDPLNDRADELARAAAMGQPPRARMDAPRPSEPMQGRGASAAAIDSTVNEAEMIRALRPLLREDETIRRCVSCGRPFVAPAQAADVFAHCSLAACQLKAREAAASPKN
jgi:hypothetical protein